MSKKLLIIFFINFFLFLFFTKDTFAVVCDLDLKWCKAAIDNPNNVCCRDSSCNTGSSRCGTISKWEYCYAYDCCATYYSSSNCSFYGGAYCYGDWYYKYKYEQCSVADSCKNTQYLQPGLCLDSGCAKGGNYKICCKPDGSSCTCINGNHTGTCPSDCPNQGPNVTKCPQPGATPTPTPKPGEPTPTPKPGATPTPTPKPGAPTPTPAPGGDIIMCQLIKSFHLISSISSYLVHINPLKSEVFAGEAIK